MRWNRPRSGRAGKTIEASVPNPLDSAVLSEDALLRSLSSEQLVRLTPLLHETSDPAYADVMTAEELGGGAYVILASPVKVYVTGV